MGYVAPQKQWVQGANRSRAGGPERICNAADAAFAGQPFGLLGQKIAHGTYAGRAMRNNCSGPMEK